jgi:hypothetical protein
MRTRLFLLLLVVLPTLVTPAQAGIIFGRGKKKVNPTERVPELVTIIKTDKDEHQRARAIEELRKFDAAKFPDIVPVLIDALQNDKKPVVRAEAAQALGKLRPPSPLAGPVLEQALAKDPSMRVRLQARSALLHYQWAGYRTGKKGAPPIDTKEPPLAAPDKGPLPPVIHTTPTPVGPAPSPAPTPEPLKAAPERLKPRPQPAASVETPVPLPAPAAPAATKPAPPPAPPGEGPTLEESSRGPF